MFVGDIAPAFVDELKKLTSQGIAEILPFHSNLDSFYAVSDILLDIGGDMDNDIFLSSKLISYLPLERPILAISGVPSPARDVAKDCVSIVHARNDGAEIEEGILKCIQLIGKNIDDRTSLLEEFKIETTALKLFNDILNESSLDH